MSSFLVQDAQRGCAGMPQWSDRAYHWSGSLQCPADANKIVGGWRFQSVYEKDQKGIPLPHTMMHMDLEIGNHQPENLSLLLIHWHLFWTVTIKQTATWQPSHRCRDRVALGVGVVWMLLIECLGLQAVWPVLRHVFFYVFPSRSSSSSGRLSDMMALMADWIDRSAQSQMTLDQITFA